MKNFKRKLLGIPVWVVALMLVVGSVAGASIWILTVNVPVDYSEPVEVYYNSEDMDSEVGPLPLRETRTTDATDLTYGTLHDYVRVVNPANGKTSLELTVQITAYESSSHSTQSSDIGFVYFQGEVDPQDVSWSYDSTTGDRISATYSGTTRDVSYGSLSFTHTFSQGEEVTYTVINVQASGVDVSGCEIVWNLSETSV